jgi:hypothetical protein
MLGFFKRKETDEMNKHANSEPPREYVGNRRRNMTAETVRDNPPPTLPDYAQQNRPLSRYSQIAADAARHTHEMEQRVAELEAELAKRDGHILYQDKTIVQLQTENEAYKLRWEASVRELGEIKGELTAAANVLVGVFDKHKPQQPDGAAVAATLGEHAVAEELMVDGRDKL